MTPETIDTTQEPASSRAATGSPPALLPCPWCGSKAELSDTTYLNTKSFAARWVHEHSVRCARYFKGCFTSKTARTPEEAVAKWNTRAANAPISATEARPS